MNLEINAEYLAVVLNSIIRMTTPVLLATLAAAICSKVKVFNIALEGSMLAAAFFSIVANYFTGSVILSIFAGVISSVIINFILAILIVKFNASPVVVGMGINTMMGGVTTYLMYLIFKTKGSFTSPDLVRLPRIEIPFLKDIPLIGTIFSDLTIIDYLSFISSIVLFIFLYKTVQGFRIRAVGINTDAARSLGTNVEKYQIITTSLSGILCGLAGVVLSMGTVTIFIQNITSGRGYIALAANNLGMSHPIGALISSLFFGFFQAIGNVLQNTSLKTQITASIPYVATIIALILFQIRKNLIAKRKKINL